jgi:hypothetical protein
MSELRSYNTYDVEVTVGHLKAEFSVAADSLEEAVAKAKEWKARQIALSYVPIDQPEPPEVKVVKVELSSSVVV